MVSKAWKNFVNESLTEFEQNSAKAAEGVEDSTDEMASFAYDPIKSDKRSWCNTIDRSLGYAFKSFCRFVVARTLSESAIHNVSEIGPDLFRDLIDRNFRLRESRQPAPLPNYCQSYPRYARWHNWRVRTDRLLRTRRRCNLSYFRALAASRPRARRRPPRPPSPELGRYRVVKPVNSFPATPLSAAFE